MASIRGHIKRLSRITGLPYCRCLQRMRKLESYQARRKFLALAERKYAELDRKADGLPDEEDVEDLEYELGL